MGKALPVADRTPEQQAFADLFLALGVRLPLRACGPLGREIRDADNHILLVVPSSGSQSTDRARALAIVAAVNAATGTPDHEAGPLPVLRPMTPGTMSARTGALRALVTERLLGR